MTLNTLISTQIDAIKKLGRRSEMEKIPMFEVGLKL